MNRKIKVNKLNNILKTKMKRNGITCLKMTIGGNHYIMLFGIKEKCHLRKLLSTKEKIQILLVKYL